MKSTLLFLLCALAASADVAAQAQPKLTVQDYEAFYNTVLLKASNASKDEWLASYDPIVTFITRVRQEVERLPEATQTALARAVHDNGYWKGQQARVRDTADPFVGAKLTAGDAVLRTVLTPAGYDANRSRYTQGARGYRFTLEAVSDRAAFYKAERKAVPRLSTIPATTTIVNANAQSWDDLVADSARYPDPAERMRVIVRNQFNAIASALALMRGRQPRSDAEMDYATAVIWRYTGHFSGKEGWEKEPLVRVPYAQLPDAEKLKDRPVWKAVREALKSHPM
jgi:hypothetical protein